MHNATRPARGRRRLAAAAAVSLCLAAVLASSADARPLVIGGSAAAPTGWPSVAYLSGTYSDARDRDHKFACTGTVIAPNRTTTAAHCTRSEDFDQPTAMTATIGNSDRGSAAAERIPVDEFAPHPYYDEEQNLNDIALVHLARATREAPMRVATR